MAIYVCKLHICSTCCTCRKWYDWLEDFHWYGHDDIIQWKHFPRYWPFVRGIHRPSVNSPHKDQWRGALMFSLIQQLSKQGRRWWFETPSRSLWRHCNMRPWAGILITAKLHISSWFERFWLSVQHILTHVFTLSDLIAVTTSSVFKHTRYIRGYLTTIYRFL